MINTFNYVILLTKEIPAKMPSASGIPGHVKLIILNIHAFVFGKIYHIC